MMNLLECLNQLQGEELTTANAASRLCQEIILSGIAKSSLSNNVTIKGGVVMRSLSEDARRATVDLDIDFIRYSLDDVMIRKFIDKVNCLDGINIAIVGAIEELKQQDYKGKRVYIRITDTAGNQLDSKIDFGVHKYLEIEQDEYCFGVCFDEEGALLLINSREQMFAEKIKSLLKFGTYSTRYKDIFDLCYLARGVRKDKLQQCLDIYVFKDANMLEKDMGDIKKRLGDIFENKKYLRRVMDSRKNWLEIDIDDAIAEIFKALEQV